MLDEQCTIGQLLANPEQDDDAKPDYDAEDIDADTIVERDRAAKVAAEDEDDEDDYDITGPRIIADVNLAKVIGA
jgi:hypothetical protein